MYEEWVSWESLSRIEVPKIRVYTRKSPEKEESIRSAVRRNPEVFFHRSPLVVTRSAESGRLFLGDGADRLKIAIEERVPRVMLSIEEYETDSEAYEAAQDDSYRMNEDRGDVVAYSVVELIRERHQKGMTVKEIAERYDKSESYIYNILAVARDEELMKLLREEKITLHEAIKAAYNPELKRELTEKFIKTMTVIEEPEKSRIEEILAKGAIVGEIKPLAAIGEEISARKPSFEEIFDEAVERVEARLQRPMNATLKAEMRNALQGLGLSSLDDIEYILLNAENNWGKEKSDVIKKAVRIWRRRVGELESPAMWGSISFEEVLEEAREAAEEERARRAEREAYWGPRAGRPAATRAGPKPAASARESMVEARPAPGVEEAGVEEPRPSAEYMEAKRRILPARRVEARTVLMELLMREFPWAGDPSILANEFIGIYDEAGPIGTLITLKLAMPRLMKILKPSRPPPRAIGWLSIVESAPFYKKRNEVINAIYQTYQENRDKILEAVARHKEEEARVLLEVFKSVEPRIVEHESGHKTYLYFVPEKPMVALVVDKEVYVTLRDVEGEKGAKRRERRVRVQEALAERRFLGVRWWINKGAVAKTEEVRVLESPEGLGVFECPGCGEVARDLYTGLPFICHKCLWPIPFDSLPYQLRDSRRRGAQQ
jgi:transcriptional regulator with XRE-family HTH domain/predicted RNA-binding Zn-ribbon protein involved in translation (DUF1610 family)